MAAHAKTCTCGTCGAPTDLLDVAFQAPDCIWAQPAAERSPLNNADFAELGSRRFVRCLLPVRLEDGREFHYGIWLEIDHQTFKEVLLSWADEERYPKLRFVAKVANAARPWGEKLLGVEVDVGVRDQRSRPFVIAARARWLQEVLGRGWTAAEYGAVVDRYR